MRYYAGAFTQRHSFMASKHYESLEDIIADVKSGIKVYWINKSYVVENWPNGPHIVFQLNRNAISLAKAYGDGGEGILSLFYSCCESPTVTNC